MFSIREIFELAMQIEKNGEAFYRHALKRTANAALNSLLEWLIEQEVKHVSWFSERKEKAQDIRIDLKMEEVGSSILKGVLGEQSFSLKEADLSKIKTAEALLHLAVEFEKDTILFYEMIGSLIEDEETSRKLDEIIEEENRHIQLLEEFDSKEVEILDGREAG